MRNICVQLVLIVMVLPAAVSTANAQTDQCFPSPEGLVAWWPADGDGTEMVAGRNAVAVNGASFGAGNIGSAFHLDGVTSPYDQRFDLPHDTMNGLGDLTVELWVKTGDTVASILNGAALAGDNQFNIYHRSVYLEVVVLRHIWVTSATVNDNVWHHVAVTRSGATVDVYVDGAFADSHLFPTGQIPIDAGGLMVGQEQDCLAGCFSPTQALDGLVDELTIYDRALSFSEIQAIFDAGFAGKCKDEDGDGYYPPKDCDETDPTINPDGIEFPGNFVDENCDGNLGDCSPCDEWRNHGEYIRCTSQAVAILVNGGALTEDEGDALVSSAARSDVGKKSFVPPPVCTP